MPSICLAVVYIVLVKTMAFIMKYFQEFNLKFLNLIYNVCSILLNVYICSKIVYLKYKAKDFGLCTTIQATGSEYSIEVSWILFKFTPFTSEFDKK